MRHLHTALALSVVLALAGACNSEPGKLAAAPGAPEVRITPDAPGSDSSLELQIVTESVDPDGDFAGYRYAWLQDGVEQAELAGSTLVPDLVTARGQIWEVRVTPFDEMGQVGVPGSASTTIVNSPPNVEIAISPNPASTDVDLALEVESDDADGDTVVLVVTWARNGVASTSYDGLWVIPANYTDEGDDWSVHVLPSDGTDEGEAQVATVRVGNAAPVVNSFSISPEHPREGDSLSASATVSDVDGDWVTVAYQWFVAGVEVDSQVTTALSAEHFDKHQEVWAVVVPTDSRDTVGAAVESNHVTVENTPPAIDTVSISPASGGELAVFTCVPAGWVDPDPADVDETYDIQWWVNNIAGLTTETIDGSSFSKHDDLRCQMVPTDEDGSGEARESALLEVANTVPTAVSVELISSETTPGLAYETSTLTAQPAGYADIDPADANPGWQFEWLVGGLPVTATGATLNGDHFDKGQDVQVVASPFDGDDAGAPMSSGTIDILNTLPTVVSVAISPDPAYTNTSLTAVPDGWSDPDDPPGYQYSWTVAGSPAGTDSSELNSSLYSLGDSIQVTIIPDDGEQQNPASAVSSPLPFTISDAPPNPAQVHILPADPRPGIDPLSCIFTADPLDPDGHAVSHVISWQLEGVGFVGATSNIMAGDTVAASFTETGQEWTCRVESSDPQGNSDSAEAVIVLLIPYFSLLDRNQTSPSFATLISPRDYRDLDVVSAWYFGDAVASSSLLDFLCLEDVQDDLDLSHAALGIQILGINAQGQEAGEQDITDPVDLPWLQDESTVDVADSWGASTRELFILHEDNLIAQVYDLQQHNVCVAAERVFLVNLLVSTVAPAGDDDDSAAN